MSLEPLDDGPVLNEGSDYEGIADAIKDVDFKDEPEVAEPGAKGEDGKQPDPKPDEKPEGKKDGDPGVELPKVKIGNNEYVLDDDNTKLFADALESHRNMREIRASATNQLKEAANMRHASQAFVDFVKSLAGNDPAMAKEKLAEDYGEAIAKKFDELLTTDLEKVRHPAELELEKIEKEKAAEEGERMAAIQIADLKANPKYGLTEAELDKIWEQAVTEYKANPESFKLDLESTFRRMPLYEEKIRAAAQKEAEVAAAEKKRLEDEEAAKKRGKPPLKGTGTAGSAKAPERYEDIKFDNSIFT